MSGAGQVHDAGIKLWILTGDKLETAVNIGFSCRVLLPQMRLVQLILKDKDDAKACNSLARSLRDLVLALRDIARDGGMDDETDPLCVPMLTCNSAWCAPVLWAYFHCVLTSR